MSKKIFLLKENDKEIGAILKEDQVEFYLNHHAELRLSELKRDLSRRTFAERSSNKIFIHTQKLGSFFNGLINTKYKLEIFEIELLDDSK